ncbi:hypothetical protein C4D60_Mb02t05360 [Musa balbisiana]|uniref:Cytochrome P450 family protein n=1 Tax=Musa balbisiana TaxID=52838 RepID=A0A4S8I8F1_MUSBA|nr:hypothetical protein C4D60_Mb02t05360 [Musa balbisiana]
MTTKGDSIMVLEMDVYSVAALFVLFFSSLLFFCSRRSRPPEPTDLTLLRSYPVVRNLPHFVKNRHRLLEWVTELVAASPTATVTVAPFVFTASTANVEHVTKANFGNYPKGDADVATLHDFLGRGIFNSNGADWKSQRKTASFEFNTRSLRAFVLDKARRELVGRLLPLLNRASRSGDVVDLQDVLERFAFDNICSLVFGMDPKCLGGGSEEGERFFHAFDRAAHLSIERMNWPFAWMWKLQKWLGVGAERRLRESMLIVHDVIEKAVKARRSTPIKSDMGSDFLSRFAADGANSDEYVRDILISFVLAGRDTTPSALTWFFWLLSSRPDVVNRIREEVKRIRSRRQPGNDGEEAVAFTLEELREMAYVHAAISESLRLYPPVPLLPRVSAEEDETPDGARVRKGWTVMYNAYAIARREGVWGADCGEFRPERWLDEEGVFRPKSPFVFPVFHAGPRMCLGKDMAYIQMKALVAGILERFDVEVAEERRQPRHVLTFTMRMEGGLPVRVKAIEGV